MGWIAPKPAETVTFKRPSPFFAAETTTSERGVQGVADGAGASEAPMSQMAVPSPLPSSGVFAQSALSPASMAGLLGRRAWVWGLPLGPLSGLSSGSLPI